MKPHALAIAGPTASGKTGLALAIAAHLQEQGGAEIISVAPPNPLPKNWHRCRIT